jgi:hypothetical protein
MLAWYVNRVAMIVIAVVVLALAGTQLPALARVLAERHYRSGEDDRTDPSVGAEESRGRPDDESASRHGRETHEGTGRDDDDEGPASMQRSG